MFVPGFQHSSYHSAVGVTIPLLLLPAHVRFPLQLFQPDVPAVGQRRPSFPLITLTFDITE